MLQLPITMSVIRPCWSRSPASLTPSRSTGLTGFVRVPRDDVRGSRAKPHFMMDEHLVGLIDAFRSSISRKSGEGSEPMSVVVVSDRGNRFGMIVDDSSASATSGSRPLDPRLGKVPDINSCLGPREWLAGLDRRCRGPRPVDRNLLGGGGSGSPAPGTRKPSGRPERVLVVDDSITVRELERQLLENRG